MSDTLKTPAPGAKRGKPVFKKGERVHWECPNSEVPSGEYVVFSDYPATFGSGSYVEVVLNQGQVPYLALPEELKVIVPVPYSVGCQNTTGLPSCSKCPLVEDREGGANG